jgi:hypothetical protein
VSGLAFQQPTTQPRRADLSASGVLSEAWRLYKRLFARSLVMGAIIFGLLHLLEALLRSGRAGILIALATLFFTVAGTAMLQGGLVEVVRGLHEDGDDDPSALASLARASARLGRLVGVALYTAIGIGFGCLLFLVPGLVAMTRWSLAVPVAMVEDAKTDEAIRRSKQLVAGHGWVVFRVILATALITFLVALPFAFAARGAGVVGWWIATTLGTMLTAPYTAHALTVVYYTLTEPERPVILEHGKQWQSIWEEQRPPAAATDSAWAEYERKFDEREARWGGRVGG